MDNIDNFELDKAKPIFLSYFFFAAVGKSIFPAVQRVLTTLLTALHSECLKCTITLLITPTRTKQRLLNIL